MTTLAIVIVSWNARDDLVRCLESLHAAAPAVPHEVLVVDNGSTDGAPDVVRDRFPSVRLISGHGNVGFAAANNIGIRQSRSELVLLLNPDTVVPAGAVDTLVGELRRFPAAAAIGPRLVDETGAPELSLGARPSPATELWQKVIGGLARQRIFPGPAVVNALTSRPRAVSWVSGACLLVRRTDAEAVGLLDERYFLYWEDVAFCLALARQGREVRFTPACTIVHRRGRSAGASAGAAALAYRRAQLAFYAAHAPGWLPAVRVYLRLRGRLPSE